MTQTMQDAGPTTSNVIRDEAEQQNTDCCSPAHQTSCCAPEEKAACCEGDDCNCR